MAGVKRKRSSSTGKGYLPSGKRFRNMSFGQRAAAASRGRLSYGRILSSQGRKGEIKALDTVNGAGSAVSYVLSTTAVITCMNLVQAGSSFFNRVGRKIEMKSLQIQGFISPIGVAQTSPTFAKIMVVYDRQTNGGLPSIQDILQDTDQSGTNSTTALSMINLNNRERFLVLAEEKIWLPAATALGVLSYATDGSQKTQFNIERFIKLRGLKTHFKADSSPAVIGDIATGGLFLVVYSTDGTAGSYNFTSTWRLRYDDT